MRTRHLAICLTAAMLCAAPASAADDGLLAHWTMDEIVAGVVPDASGRGHDATVGPEGVQLELTPGMIGKALKLKEDQQAFLKVAKSEDFALAKNITVMAWIKPAARAKTYEILCMKGDKSGEPPWPGWRFRFFWTRIAFEYGTADGKQPRASSPEWSAPAGFWSHVAATFDERTIRIYVNGVEKASAPGEGDILPNKSRPLIIGNYIGRKNAYAFDGLLDDVKVFNRVLTEQEIFAEAVRGLP
jgi:hypothetical protein